MNGATELSHTVPTHGGAPGFLAACLLALAGLAVAGGARAAEDAGTQSPFSFGVGPRALGMGSAFVAAVDDASAIVWNPAGLGAVTRLQIQAAQRSEFVMDVHESFAVVALPSWRWGTTALSLRTYGVGDIDGRDERNIETGEITNRELEVALGYGFAWAHGVHVGGAAKLQQQSLAGLTANGLGLDLGLQLEPAAALSSAPAWANGFTVGIAARNMVRPTLRLDRDAVADPSTLRGGVAWRGPTASLGNLLAEIDLEKAQGVSPRVRTGVEYRPIAGWALRVGHDGSALSAGTSFQWRDLGFHYSYVDNPIISEHQFGVAVALGPSTVERHQAAQRSNDEELERRLAAGFAERQDRQVTDLIARAEASRASGNLDAALEALDFAQILDPGRADAATLATACLMDRAAALERAGDWITAAVAYEQVLASAPGESLARAGVARCRAESDHRAARSSHARELFRGALDSFATGDLSGARDGFAAALRETPEDAEAAGMLARTERAIARRCADNIQQARRMLRAGNLAEARALVEQATALDPATPGLSVLRAALTRASQPTTPPKSVREPIVARRLDDRELEALYRKGLAAYERRQLEDAVRYWELVWSNRPGYREVNDLLKREYLTRGIEAFGDGRLEEATAQWDKVLRIDPADERARGYLARAQKQIARTREIFEERP
jgi:tetratricopeptide (TPR) repeat protein